MEIRVCKRIESLRKFAGHERGGALSMDLDRAPRCWFSQVPHFCLGGPKYSGVMAEPVPDARSLEDRRIFLLKVFGDHEPNQTPIERRSDASAKPT
jgi:hypothetical protein